MKRSILFGIFLLAISGSLSAQPYLDGSRPLRMIVPFGAGSGTDLLARAYGRAIEEVANINVVIENKAGANGIIGSQAAMAAEPDGYTILLANSSTHVLNEHIFKNIPYRPIEDFVPISTIAKYSLVLNAGPSTNFANASELIEAIRSTPGKYSYGYGTGSTQIAAEIMVHLASGKMLGVPYKTMSAATLALASGEIDILMNDASTAIPYYKTGQVRPLGTTGNTRMAALPEVPTLKEQGLPDYEFTGWHAIYFPAGIADSFVLEMQRVLEKAARSKGVAEALAINSFEPLEITGAKVTELQRKESEKWGGLIRELGIEPR